MQWEYKSIYHAEPTDILNELNELGKQGWEAIAFGASGAWLKRPIEPIRFGGGAGGDKRFLQTQTTPESYPHLQCENLAQHDPHLWVSYLSHDERKILSCNGVAQ